MDLKEKYKNARAFVVLLAALIAWLLSIKYKRELLEALIIELIVIIVFYIIASIAIKLVDKIRNMEVKLHVDEELPVPEEAPAEENKE